MASIKRAALIDARYEAEPQMLAKSARGYDDRAEVSARLELEALSCAAHLDDLRDSGGHYVDVVTRPARGVAPYPALSAAA